MKSGLKTFAGITSGFGLASSLSISGELHSLESRFTIAIPAENSRKIAKMVPGSRFAVGVLGREINLNYLSILLSKNSRFCPSLFVKWCPIMRALEIQGVSLGSTHRSVPVLTRCKRIAQCYNRMKTHA